MKQHPRNRTLVRYLIAWLAAVLVVLPTFAEPEHFNAADSQGVTATRDSTALYLAVDTEVKGSIKIPRLAAPLRSMVWQGSTADDGVSLKPEQGHWVINWKSRPAQDATLVLQFDDEPLLLSEIEAIKKTGDGSFYLPAHLAATRGKKIRYEPQTAKNTVGYWTGKQDAATWRIKLNKPGRFNVAILQGCGKGQGGSDATMSFVRPVDTKTQDASLDFKVVETGHFQNFQWRTLGEVSLNTAGEIDLIVMPKQIKKGALMDIRAIHLIRLPDKKK